ncbi:MAG: VWA domain-containing protein [Bacteroidales bacterium]|nr:VWA domain-containing protein [Bacteroidales bacterium]
MSLFSDIVFARPLMLLLLAIIPVLTAWYSWRHRERTPDIRFVHDAFIRDVRKTLRLRLIHLPFVFRMFAVALLILGLARPQSTTGTRDVTVEGIDIMIALDISGSMLAEDFRPNRMEAAKITAMEFIGKRPNDRIGMTVFSGQSFTLVPLTTDHALLKRLASGVTTGMVEDGTAIGDGLATAINRLRDSDAVSRVIVLLTDGINNTGLIDPLTAAEIAALYDIRVYTIGVGSSGYVPYPFPTPYGVQYRDVEIPVDEELLQAIADMTGGKYYWADSQGALENVYTEIDQLERTTIDVVEFTTYNDEFMILLLLALGLAGMEFLLKHLWLRTIP